MSRRAARTQQAALRVLQKAVDAMAAALVPTTTSTPAVPNHDDLEGDT